MERKILLFNSLASNKIMSRLLSKFKSSKFLHFISGSGHDDDVDGLSIENIVNGIKNHKYDHIIFMCGAGISTCMFKFVLSGWIVFIYIFIFIAAGIPDFRSPKTGLFSQLEKYNLPYPEAVFDVSFFKV